MSLLATSARDRRILAAARALVEHDQQMGAVSSALLAAWLHADEAATARVGRALDDAGGAERAITLLAALTEAVLAANDHRRPAPARRLLAG